MNKIVIICLVFISIGLQIKLWCKADSINNIIKLNQEIAQKTKELHTLQLRNEILLNNIQQLKKNPTYIEEQARVVLGMIKKHETYYRIIESNNENFIK